MENIKIEDIEFDNCLMKLAATKSIEDINRNGPLHGIGKPELLKHEKSGLYSRRTDEANRLVYEISDNQIIVKGIMKTKEELSQTAASFLLLWKGESNAQESQT